jgi:DNA-directed RNA polymerase subunit N (RpoN/RPB10)
MSKDVSEGCVNKVVLHWITGQRSFNDRDALSQLRLTRYGYERMVLVHAGLIKKL